MNKEYLEESEKNTYSSDFLKEYDIDIHSDGGRYISFDICENVSINLTPRDGDMNIHILDYNNTENVEILDIISSLKNVGYNINLCLDYNNYNKIIEPTFDDIVYLLTLEPTCS